LDNAPNVRLIHHHQLSVQCRLGSLDLDVKLELSTQWTLLFGPSGSGKSSLLRAACGLLECKGVRFARRLPDDSWQVLEDATTHTPTHLRRLSWAPQHASLFPHLSVRDNIAFGAGCSKTSDTGTRDANSSNHQALIADAMQLFRIDTLAPRLPRDLSGGERQRVNLARAFATPGCELMLLDEPFAGIDHTLRDQLLPHMRAWLRDRGIPALSVSHNVEEALQLQAEVVLLRDGKVEGQGYVSKVLRAERERLLSNLGNQNIVTI
jgi:molybdate transport system ATP-binding protein